MGESGVNIQSGRSAMNKMWFQVEGDTQWAEAEEMVAAGRSRGALPAPKTQLPGLHAVPSISGLFLARPHGIL
jgi:hypothetical protein